MTLGELYFCSDEAILVEQEKCLDMLYDYNQTRPTEGKKRT
ncbi:MAG: sugar O-acetyltransferase, partial [Clostridia bacterium]|nr:sugar O-acetyltransferase [Clostridia bacterium]